MKAYAITAQTYHERSTVIAVALSMEQAEKYVDEFNKSIEFIKAFQKDATTELAQWDVTNPGPQFTFDEPCPVLPQGVKHKDLHPVLVKAWKEWNGRNSQAVSEYREASKVHGKARQTFNDALVNAKKATFTEIQHKAMSIAYCDDIVIEEVDLID